MSTKGEVVFVVDVSSFTENGFVGTTKFSGKPIAIEFDAGESGIFLNHEMAQKLGVKKGSKIYALIEDDKTLLVSTFVAAVGKLARISDTKIYYAIGKEGGAVIRIRKS